MDDILQGLEYNEDGTDLVSLFFRDGVDEFSQQSDEYVADSSPSPPHYSPDTPPQQHTASTTETYPSTTFFTGAGFSMMDNIIFGVANNSASNNSENITLQIEDVFTQLVESPPQQLPYHQKPLGGDITVDMNKIALIPQQQQLPPQFVIGAAPPPIITTVKTEKKPSASQQSAAEKKQSAAAELKEKKQKWKRQREEKQQRKAAAVATGTSASSSSVSSPPNSVSSPASSSAKSTNDIDALLAGITDEAELKKQKRMIKNRLSAQASRDRRKKLIDELEVKVTELEKDKKELSTRIAHLESENAFLRQENDSLRQRLNLPSMISPLPTLPTRQITRAAVPAVMLVVLFSFVFIFNFEAMSNKNHKLRFDSTSQSTKVTGANLRNRGRTLLFNDTSYTTPISNAETITQVANSDDTTNNYERATNNARETLYLSKYSESAFDDEMAIEIQRQSIIYPTEMKRHLSIFKNADIDIGNETSDSDDSLKYVERHEAISQYYRVQQQHHLRGASNLLPPPQADDYAAPPAPETAKAIVVDTAEQVPQSKINTARFAKNNPTKKQQSTNIIKTNNKDVVVDTETNGDHSHSHNHQHHYNHNNEYIRLGSNSRWEEAILYSHRLVPQAPAASAASTTINDDKDDDGSTLYLFCPNVYPLFALPKAPTATEPTQSGTADAEEEEVSSSSSSAGPNTRIKNVSILLPLNTINDNYMNKDIYNSLYRTFEFSRSPYNLMVTQLQNVDIESFGRDLGFLSFGPNATAQMGTATAAPTTAAAAATATTTTTTAPVAPHEA